METSDREQLERVRGQQLELGLDKVGALWVARSLLGLVLKRVGSTTKRGEDAFGPGRPRQTIKAKLKAMRSSRR